MTTNTPHNTTDDADDAHPSLDTAPHDEYNDTHPVNAVHTYLSTRRNELAAQTLQSHRYRLTRFIEWCRDRGITDINTLDGTDLHHYRLSRQDNGNVNTVTLHTQLSTLNVFLKFCERIDLIDTQLHNALLIPSLDDDADRRDTVLTPDHADNALTYLDTYEYASTDHVLLTLLWRTGMRIGAVRALDVQDVDTANGQLHVQHRPQGGTSLKLGDNGERVVAITADTTQLITDYIDHNRMDVTDDNGRHPLITYSSTSRPSRSTLRAHVHRCTQPCLWHGTCPHDRTVESCIDVGVSAPNAGCPSSTPPHDVRRGSITYALQNDVPKQVVADRMNVQEDTLDKHYDQRSAETKAEQRRQYFTDL